MKVQLNEEESSLSSGEACMWWAHASIGEDGTTSTCDGAAWCPCGQAGGGKSSETCPSSTELCMTCGQMHLTTYLANSPRAVQPRLPKC